MLVEALQVAQVVLVQQPDHHSALELSLDAHRQLMAQDGHNFWARGWSQTWIGKLEAAPAAVNASNATTATIINEG